MNDRILIRGLALETVIGIHDWERKRPRLLRLDLELETDVAAAAKTDRIAQALDYHAVCETARRYGAETQHQLIETFAEGLAHKILREFACPQLRLTIYKPGAVPGAQDVGVSIERTTR